VLKDNDSSCSEVLSHCLINHVISIFLFYVARIHDVHDAVINVN